MRREAFRAARVEQGAQAEDEDPAAAAKIADAFEAESTALQLLAQQPRVQTFVTLDKPLFIEQLPIADLSQFPDHHIEPFNSWFKVNIATNSGPRHKGGTTFVGYYLWQNPSDHYAVGTATATMTLNGTASLEAAPGGLLMGDFAGLYIETSLKARRWTGWGTDSAGHSLDGTTYPVDATTYPVDATKQIVFWDCYGGADRTEGFAPLPAGRGAVAPRLLEEHPDATIEEAALAASCLVALPGAGYLEAAQTLKPMAERTSSRRRAHGVA